MKIWRLASFLSSLTCQKNAFQNCDFLEGSPYGPVLNWAPFQPPACRGTPGSERIKIKIILKISFSINLLLFVKIFIPWTSWKIKMKNFGIWVLIICIVLHSGSKSSYDAISPEVKECVYGKLGILFHHISKNLYSFKHFQRSFEVQGVIIERWTLAYQ